ncbi:hypothetical protein HJG60_009207 [Phyllostomus discolor]|uniref:Uncharacterized protein n=1 Tax=Phyllostomus discolor TaxID=89673 RepID=A0A833YFP6_9CHIR|nr:hypothetical protein HJG60_009207 [Phyllostomus discolor]
MSPLPSHLVLLPPPSPPAHNSPPCPPDGAPDTSRHCRPLPCPRGAAGEVDVGLWPRGWLLPPPRPLSQDRRSWAPPSAGGHLAVPAQAPLGADIQAVLKVTLCDVSPGADTHGPIRAGFRLHLSSLIAFEWV